MYHDFIDPYANPKTIFRDAAGNTCTNVNGVMDYYVTVQKWTTCSVERFTRHYNNVIASAGSFCMPLNTGTTPGELLSKLKNTVCYPKSTHLTKKFQNTTGLHNYKGTYFSVALNYPTNSSVTHPYIILINPFLSDCTNSASVKMKIIVTR